MFLVKLFRFITGFISITVEGYFVERFINMCSTKGIKIWGIKRKKSGLLECNISIKDFKRIRNISKKSKCKVKIQRKEGFNFILNKYKKRKVFVVALLIIALLIIINSMFIWNIELICEGEIDRNELLNQLSVLGVDVGKSKFDINTKEIENQIRLLRNDIAWIGIEITGTNLRVELVKSVEKPEIINENEYCNIVSDYDGIITKISVKNGTALVKENDIITKGQLLVIGMIEGKHVEDKCVHADAEIEAKVWKTFKKKIYLTSREKQKTGNEENKFQIEIKNFKINLYKNDTNFKMYDKITTESNLKIFSNFYIPIKIIKNNYYEVENIEKVITKQEAVRIGVDEAKEELKFELGEELEIVNENVICYEQEDCIELEITFEILRKIGIKEKI